MIDSMTQQELDNQIREDLKRAKAPPRRRGGFLRILLFFLVPALILGTVSFVAYQQVDSLDSLRRRLTYTKAEQDENGRSELFRYDSDRTSDFAAVGNGLLIVSTTRVQLLGADGAELFSKTVNFTNPAIETGAQTAAVYDVGGQELYLFSPRGLLRDMSGECGNGVLSVTINNSGYLTLSTLKSGYRTTVTVFDAAGTPVFTLNSSDRYISDACVLSDNRHLAAVMLGDSNGVFASTLTFYSLSEEKPVSSTTLTGSMVLSLRTLGGTLASLEDDRLTLFHADGSLAGSYRYEYPYLRGRTEGADFAVLLLSRHRSGSAMRLVSVGADGTLLGSLDVQREVLSISAAGRYIAILYGDSLTLCNADLTEYASLPDTDYARQVMMRADGTALLIAASRAWLFVP